jgi:hypothetical protein
MPRARATSMSRPHEERAQAPVLPLVVDDHRAFAAPVAGIDGVTAHADDLFVRVFCVDGDEGDVAPGIELGEPVEQRFAGMPHGAEEAEVTGFRRELLDEAPLFVAILRKRAAG